MKILHRILSAVGMAAHAVPPAFRFGKFLLLLGGLLTANATAAPPPTDWHWVLPSSVLPNPFNSEDFDVAHGNGIFVGVGGVGAVATSSDGLNWRPVLPGTLDYLYSVAFGGGTFVAVGGENTHTSTNGTHWVHHAGLGAGNYDQLVRVRYLNGLFVATGTERLFTGDSLYAGVLYTSPNGITWTRRLRILPPTGADVNPAGIAYGNGRFVAAWYQYDGISNSNEGLIYTSTNGLQWTRAGSDPLVVAPLGLAFGEAGFVLLDSWKRILTSSDGVAWQVRHELTDGWHWESHWFGELALSGNRIVCLAKQYPGQSRLAVVSDDGISWQESPLSGNLFRRVYSDGVTFFAIGTRSALSSPDGIAWTEHFTPNPLDLGTAGLRAVTYGDQGFVAVGDAGTILSSGDGLRWERRISGTGEILTGVIHGGGKYVAAGLGGSLIHSSDGRNWAQVDLGVGMLDLGPLAHGSGRFVLFTQTGGTGFWTSEDGIAWQLRFSDAVGFFDRISSVAFGNGRFVATGRHFRNGDRAEVAVSEDGITWQRIIPPEPYSALWDPKVIHAGNRFLAWGFRFGRVLLASPDGLAWTTLVEGSGNLNSVGYGDGNIVALRGSQIGLLESSVDGSSWTTVAPLQFPDIFDGPLRFAYGAGRFVGVGHAYNTARLLVSGYTPPLSLPQLDLRREAARLMLRIRGAAGSSWNLQQSSTLGDWQTVGPVTLGAEPLDIEVTSSTESQGFWRLAAPNQ